jgi:hypothetical protein
VERNFFGINQAKWRVIQPKMKSRDIEKQWTWIFHKIFPSVPETQILSPCRRTNLLALLFPNLINQDYDDTEDENYIDDVDDEDEAGAAITKPVFDIFREELPSKVGDRLQRKIRDKLAKGREECYHELEDQIRKHNIFDLLNEAIYEAIDVVQAGFDANQSLGSTSSRIHDNRPFSGTSSRVNGKQPVNSTSSKCDDQLNLVVFGNSSCSMKAQSLSDPSTSTKASHDKWSFNIDLNEFDALNAQFDTAIHELGIGSNETYNTMENSTRPTVYPQLEFDDLYTQPPSIQQNRGLVIQQNADVGLLEPFGTAPADSDISFFDCFSSS